MVTGRKWPYKFSKVSGIDWINVYETGEVTSTPIVEIENDNLVIRATDAENNYKDIELTIG